MDVQRHQGFRTATDSVEEAEERDGKGPGAGVGIAGAIIVILLLSADGIKRASIERSSRKHEIEMLRHEMDMREHEEEMRRAHNEDEYNKARRYPGYPPNYR